MYVCDEFKYKANLCFIFQSETKKVLTFVLIEFDDWKMLSRNCVYLIAIKQKLKKQLSFYLDVGILLLGESQATEIEESDKDR